MISAFQSKSDLEQIREMLQAMLAKGQSEDAIEMIITLLEKMRDKNTSLELRLHKLLKDKYGRKSEGITSEQLSLFMNELEEEEGIKSSQEEIEIPPLPKRKKRKARPHGRNPLPKELEREEITTEVEGAEKTCHQCGEEKECIGYEVSEVLEFIPARFKVLVHKREKLACRSCGEGVVIAPVGNKVIERGLPGAGLLAQVLVDKYADHLPLNRQAKRYKRYGVDIARSTLSDWNGAATDILKPIAKKLKEKALASYVLQADGTHLKVLDYKKASNIKRGSLWCFLGDGNYVYFKYIPNQCREGPLSVLRGRSGYVQADADPKLDELFSQEGAEAIEVGCWMHGRRGYIQALDGGDLRATIPVEYIKKLYKVEKHAQLEGMEPDEIKKLRAEYSVPILDKLKEWVKENYENERPRSPLRKAMGYTIRQWEALKRYTEDGRLPIDNGACERAIRTVAVGRRNYLFAGSDTGGERAAIAYSVLGSCALVGADPWAYLRDVFTKISSGWPQKRIEELLPVNWVQAHPEHRRSVT